MTSSSVSASSAGENRVRRSAGGFRLLSVRRRWTDEEWDLFLAGRPEATFFHTRVWARIVLAWTVFVPGAYLTSKYLHWKSDGAVVWLTTYLGLLAATLAIRFLRGRWRRIQLVGPA